MPDTPGSTLRDLVALLTPSELTPAIIIGGETRMFDQASAGRTGCLDAFQDVDEQLPRPIPIVR